MKDMMRFITVLIADKDEPFRRTLLQTLTEVEGIHVVGLADSVPDTLALARVLQPDVILLNVTLLDGSDGLAPEANLFAAEKVLMLNESGQEQRTLQTLQLGARGFLDKGEELLTKVAEAIRSVQRGEAVLSPRLTGWMLDTILH